MLQDVIPGHQRAQNGTMACKIIKADVKSVRYNIKFKIQVGSIIEYVSFDPTRNVSFEKYSQVHVKQHEIHAEALYLLPEWMNINASMKRVKCTQLKDDFCGIKYDDTYQNFTALYKKELNLQDAY